MKPSPLKLSNIFSVYLFSCLWPLEIWEEISDRFKSRCNTIDAQKTSYLPKERLIFYKKKYSRLSTYSDWLLKESVDLQHRHTPFCIWSTVFPVGIVGEKNKRKELPSYVCLAPLTLCLVSGHQSNMYHHFYLWAFWIRPLGELSLLGVFKKLQFLTLNNHLTN